MKLKSVYIEKYKNLSPLTIDFELGNGLTMLVGNNGSGKSNVLEAISGIFHDLFKGKDSRKIKCDYKLQYTLNEINCVIEQTNGFLRCYGPKFKRREYFIEENAPHNIIGLYSGEEDRLWTSFYETYYKSYIKRIKTNRHQERMFKALGLLDDNGQPLQRYYEFLDQTQTGRIIAIGIEEAYEDLFNLRKDAQNLTNDEVKNKLKTITQGQKSDKILGLMAMTFRAFCDLADWDSVGTEETNKIETPHVVLKSDNTEKSQTKTDPTTTDMNLHYNIQIHLPETTNMAVYDAIFQSLKKHLM